jgi:predicted TPR repeat methyltransferase
MEEQSKIEWIYSSKNNHELLERYDQWAKEYDTDVEQKEEYQGPKITADLFTKYVPRASRILDVGAGTGLTGQLLNILGYDNLVAMDLSKGMLDVARRKGIYRELNQMVLGETLDYATDSFDAAISTGVFTAAHAPANAFDEIVRIVRPEGYIIFTLSDDSYENAGFKEKFDALEHDGKWRLVEVSDRLKLTTSSSYYHKVWIFQVCGDKAR